MMRKDHFCSKSGMQLKYWSFDPDKDLDVKRKLPLLVFLHGTGNSLVGDLCINYTGAELYASPKYQESMGGAHILIPVGSESLGSDEVLDEYDKKDKYLFFALGKRDEFHNFKENVEPRLERLKKMKHCFIYTPDWVRNGDKGVASINFGIEMGQHCLMNGIQANLMFDDGTPMDERLPEGVTGWIAQTVKEIVL